MRQARKARRRPALGDAARQAVDPANRAPPCCPFPLASPHGRLISIRRQARAVGHIVSVPLSPCSRAYSSATAGEQATACAIRSASPHPLSSHLRFRELHDRQAGTIFRSASAPPPARGRTWSVVSASALQYTHGPDVRTAAYRLRTPARPPVRPAREPGRRFAGRPSQRATHPAAGLPPSTGGTRIEFPRTSCRTASRSAQSIRHVEHFEVRPLKDFPQPWQVRSAPRHLKQRRRRVSLNVFPHSMHTCSIPPCPASHAAWNTVMCLKDAG